MCLETQYVFTHTHTHTDLLLSCRFNPTQSQRSRPAWHRGYKRRFEEEKKWAETQEILSSITGKYPQSVIDRMSKLDMNDLNHDLAVSVVRHICLNKQVSRLVQFGGGVRWG